MLALRIRPPLPALLRLLLVGATLATTVQANPTLEWQRLHDGGSRQGDIGVAALSDSAGNLIVAGEIFDHSSNGDLLIRKLARETGDTLWSRSVAGTPDNPVALGEMEWDGAGDLLIGGTRLGCYG